MASRNCPKSSEDSASAQPGRRHRLQTARRMLEVRLGPGPSSSMPDLTSLISTLAEGPLLSQHHVPLALDGNYSIKLYKANVTKTLRLIYQIDHGYPRREAFGQTSQSACENLSCEPYQSSLFIVRYQGVRYLPR
jgi:hypothetical protein